VLVFQNGVLRAAARGATGNETTNAFTAAASTQYIVVVTGWGGTASYPTTVTVN